VTAVRLAVLAAGGALCAGMVFALGPVDQPEIVKHRAVIYFTLSFVALSIGVLVWQIRPESRIGLLLTALPLADVLAQGKWIFWNQALPVTVALAATGFGAPLLGHLTLSYPTGRLATRAERYLVGAGYTYAAVYGLTLLLFFDPRLRTWQCVYATYCALPLTHVASYDTARVTNALDWLLFPLALLFLALLVHKLVRVSPGGRRIVLPLSLAASFAAVQVIARLVLNGSPGSPWTDTSWFWIGNLASLAIPLSLGFGLLWGRAARSAVADLVIELERTPPGRVRDVLARVLGDPSLELALWLPDRQTYVDGAGRPVELPGAGAGRAVTVLGPAEARVAALVHDPVLLERRALLASAGAAARLALENERLQAELRAQLAELRASRARIVSAGDEERRRLERNLHDGAQQRLLSVGLALQLMRTQVGEEANGAVELLDEADAELRAALDELRELARGIHPAVLTEQGLGAALRSLAERSPVPVTIAEVPGRRLPAPAEAAAYFLISEALANVAKYARASRVRVCVAQADGLVLVDVDDDGVGGADPSRGSGLRGLTDRVHALEGWMELDSPPGRGTHLHAEIPCA
jgi:signal transduction histidine kinase